MKKNYYYLIAIIIALLALIIRLNNLGASGLWYDELTIYSIASKKTIALMMQEDGHRFLLFPLYYLIYKFWITTFGNSDYVIRLMAVFFDMLSVISAYFVGLNFASFINKDNVKEEIGQKVGLFAMLLYAINSSFIYYAQEAKFYSLTFFLVNILIICWIKFLKEPNIKNIISFLVLNALVLYVYTSQIVMLLIIQIVTLVYFFLYKKAEMKKYVNQILGFLIVLIPLFRMIFYDHKYFSGNFEIVSYDNSFIFLVIQNYFSPILVGLQNNPLSYQYTILSNIFNLKWWIFIFFPVIFNLFLLVKGSRKEVLSKMFVSVAVLYVAFHIFLTISTNYSVMVRYVLLVLPFLIVVTANGLEVVCRKKSGYIILALFLAVNLLVLTSPIGATKISRPQSYEILADLLVSQKINPDSNFILPIRVSLLEKYYNIKGIRYSLYSLNAEDAQKTYLTLPEIIEIRDQKNLYKNYKRFLLSDEYSKDFENYVMKNYVNNSKKDLVLVDDLGICMFTDENIARILKSERAYEGCPIQFLRLSKLENNLIKVLSKKMKLKKTAINGNWQIYVFGRKQ